MKTIIIAVAVFFAVSTSQAIVFTPTDGFYTDFNMPDSSFVNPAVYGTRYSDFNFQSIDLSSLQGQTITGVEFNVTFNRVFTQADFNQVPFAYLELYYINTPFDDNPTYNNMPYDYVRVDLTNTVVLAANGQDAKFLARPASSLFGYQSTTEILQDAINSGKQFYIGVDWETRYDDLPGVTGFYRSSESLDITAVPEPGVWAMLAIGVAMLLRFNLRRHRMA